MHPLASLTGATALPWWATAVVAFFAIMVSEIAWVLCVRWSAHSKTLRAAFGASAMVLIGWLGLIVLLGNPLVAIPFQMVGAFIGTVIAIRIDRGT
jgi:hypothetical protein